MKRIIFLIAMLFIAWALSAQCESEILKENLIKETDATIFQRDKDGTVASIILPSWYSLDLVKLDMKKARENVQHIMITSPWEYQPRLKAFNTIIVWAECRFVVTYKEDKDHKLIIFTTF